MQKIAILGTGAMGARLAAKLGEAGNAVTVWNRTAERANALAAAGMVVAASPAMAADGADVVIAAVRDDEASHAAWTGSNGALNALHPAALAIECSTLSVAGACRLHDEFSRAGRTLAEAPMVGSRPQAEAGKLVFLLGGSEDARARAQAVLTPVAGAIHHAGEAGAAAAIKLAVNYLFALQVAGIAEAINTLAGEGLSARGMEIIASLPVSSPAAALSAQAMLAGNFAAQFPIELVAKDLGYFTALAMERAPVAGALADRFAKAATSPLAAMNITAIIKAD